MFNSRWWSPNSAKTQSASSGTKLSSSDSPNGERSPTNSTQSLKEELAQRDARFSAERLRTLYTLLTSQPAIGDSNSAEIVAVLRNMSEILIWGDKNDPSVFECFLEKHMLANFVSILQQCGVVFTKKAAKDETSSKTTIRDSSPMGISEKSLFTRSQAKREPPAPEVFSISAAHHVCTQVLQLLHILFENISQDTSLYFLLSNNFINQIIDCTFDLSDDEILAHYVSLMKILSNKLNPHTIHFFYHDDQARRNDEASVEPDFPLFTRALALFSFPETMVRIAARTVILNIFNVRDLGFADRSFIHSARLPVQLMGKLLDIMAKQAVKIREFIHESKIADGLDDSELYQQSSVDDDTSTIKQKVFTGWLERKKHGSSLNDMIVEHMEYVQYVSDLAELRVQPLTDRVRMDFVEHYIRPFILFPLHNNVDALQRTDDNFTRRRLVMEILFSLLLLNLDTINLTDISVLMAPQCVEEILNSVLCFLPVLDGRDSLPPDDRLPLFALMFFLTLSERLPDLTLDGLNISTFVSGKLLPAIIGVIHRVPLVGFSTCRVIVLRLACRWIELTVIQQAKVILDDHFLAILLDAREQSCLFLRRFYKNDDAFVSLVELEVHQLHQLSQSQPKMERLLDSDLSAFLALCPKRATWMVNGISSAETVPHRPSSVRTISVAEERGFPDLSKRWPLTVAEKCRYYLRIFFLLRRLSNKLQKVTTPPGVAASVIGQPSGTGLVPAVGSSASLEEMPAPFQSVQIGDMVDISSCDTILSCTVIPFHTHLAVRPQEKVSSQKTAASPRHRPLQLLLCPSDEEKWVKRFLIIHQWQMLFVEPDNRKLGFAVVKESFVLPCVQLLNEKEQRERIICCCALAISSTHRTHDVNPSVGIETKMTLKSIFLQVQQQLAQQLIAAPNDAPWNMDSHYESYARVVFDDSIRAMAASTRIRKNQERIRELKLGAINTLLDLPIGSFNQYSDSVDSGGKEAEACSTRAVPSTSATSIKSDRVKSARHNKPVVILHGTASTAAQLLTVDSHKSSRGKSVSRGPSRERLKSSRAPVGLPIPLTRLDPATRSGFAERVEPDT